MSDREDETWNLTDQKYKLSAEKYQAVTRGRTMDDGQEFILDGIDQMQKITDKIRLEERQRIAEWAKKRGEVLIFTKNEEGEICRFIPLDDLLAFLKGEE